MSFEFRYVYDNPNPIPASEWRPVAHFKTYEVPGKLLAIQFREVGNESQNTGDDVADNVTRTLNESLDLITDANGHFVKPSIEDVLSLMAKL
jgi:hypothetical protein